MRVDMANLVEWVCASPSARWVGGKNAGIWTFTEAVGRICQQAAAGSGWVNRGSHCAVIALHSNVDRDR